MRQNEPVTARPSILILSFSPIASDARVLKQLALARELGDVVTCGYGPVPDGVSEHLRVPDDARILPLDPRLLVLRLGALALRRSTAMRWARRALAGRSFDVVVVNDLEAAPLGLRVRARGGHLLDLHEYTPRLHDEDAGWRRYLQPLFERLAARWLPRAGFVTTVAHRIAEEYDRLSGVRPGVVVNAAPFADAEPGVVADRIRLVHSGACLRNRGIVELVEAVEAASTPVSIDLYLMPNDPGLLDELRSRAAGSDRVTVNDPVPYAELSQTLRTFDLGVHVLPPVTINNEWALPNKFFDYVQARLGVIVGPSPEMVSYVERHGLGVVTRDFSVEAIVAALDELTPESVRGFKAAAHAAAQTLSAERAIDPWRAALVELLSKARS